MWETILTKSWVEEEDQEEKKERMEMQKILLKKVMDVLEETDVLDQIMSEYDKENESIEEYRKNRKKPYDWPRHKL